MGTMFNHSSYHKINIENAIYNLPIDTCRCIRLKGGCPSFARGANRFAELIFQSTSLVNIAGYNLTWNGVSNLI